MNRQRFPSLRRLPGWEAIKLTRGHYRSCGRDPKGCCVSDLIRPDPVIRSGRAANYEAGKDTGHFWDAGAANLNLSFDVACHLGTLVAVAAFFGGDIAALVRGVPSALSRRPSPDGRRIWLLAAAMLPVMIVGLTMDIDAVRDRPRLTAIALIAGAGLLFLV